MARLEDPKKDVPKILEVKAWRTLASRASSADRYLRWSKVAGVAPYPLAGDAVREFLRCQTNVAASSGRRFLEAALFAEALLESEVARDFSPQKHAGSR